MTTERSRRLQPELRVRCDARQSDYKPLWLRQTVEPFADTAGRPAPGPSDRVAARRTDELHEVTVPTQRTRTQNARTPTRDTGRPHRTLDNRPWTSHSGHWTVTPDTGHRTRGRHRVRGQSTKARHASGQTFWTTTTTRWDAEPWTCGRHLRHSATMTARRPDVPASARLPTRTTGRLLGRSVGQAAPWRTALLRRFRVESRERRCPSSAMARGLQGYWGDVQYSWVVNW
jgi:hypothetical protein